MKALCRKAVEGAVAKTVEARDKRWCTSCQNPLYVVENTWTCAKCGGRMETFSAIKRDYGQRVLSAITEEVQPYMDPVKGRSCPKCANQMLVARLPTREASGGRAWWRGQRVDVCVVCDAVWIDDGEMLYSQPS